MKFLGWPTKTLPPKACTSDPSLQPDQGIPTMPPEEHYQVEVSPEFELMELDIPEDIPDLLDVPHEVMSDFDACAHDVLSYQF